MTYLRFVLVFRHERYCRALEGKFFEFIRCALMGKQDVFILHKKADDFLTNN